MSLQPIFIYCVNKMPSSFCVDSNTAGSSGSSCSYSSISDLSKRSRLWRDSDKFKNRGAIYSCLGDMRNSSPSPSFLLFFLYKTILFLKYFCTKSIQTVMHWNGQKPPPACLTIWSVTSSYFHLDWRLHTPGRRPAPAPSLDANNQYLLFFWRRRLWLFWPNPFEVWWYIRAGLFSLLSPTHFAGLELILKLRIYEKKSFIQLPTRRTRSVHNLQVQATGLYLIG